MRGSSAEQLAAGGVRDEGDAWRECRGLHVAFMFIISFG